MANIIIQLDQLLNRKKHLENLLAKTNVNVPIGQCDNAEHMQIIISNLILLNHILVKYDKYDMGPVLEILKKYDYTNMSGGAPFNEQEQKTYDDIITSIFKGYKGDNPDLGTFVATINDFILNEKLTKDKFIKDINSNLKKIKKTADESLFKRIITDDDKKNFDRNNMISVEEIGKPELNFYFKFDETYPSNELLNKITHKEQYKKHKYITLFNNVINDLVIKQKKTTPIVSIDIPTRGKLKNIYNAGVISVNGWKSAFSDDVLKSINPALIETDKTIDDYINMYNLVANKISMQKTSSEIKTFFTNNKIDFDIKESATLKKLLERIFNHSSKAYIYSELVTNYIAIYKKIYGEIAENKQKNSIKDTVNFLIKKNIKYLKSSTFVTIYIQIHIIDEMIAYNRDNFDIIVGSLIKNIDERCQKLYNDCKNNRSEYIYLYIYILVSISIFFTYLNDFYKTDNFNIYMPEYNVQDNMPLIKVNNLYKGSSLYNFIGNYFDNIDKLKITNKEQAIMDYWWKITSIADEQISTILHVTKGTTKSTTKGTPKRATKGTHQTPSVSSTKDTTKNVVANIMAEFNENKSNPKIGNEYKTISDYAQYYIDKLKQIPNTDKQQGIINAYKINHKYVAYITKNGTAGCGVDKPHENQKSFNTRNECVYALHISYIFYFSNNYINNIMEQFWKDRNIPKIGNIRMTITQYADEYTLQLNNIPGIDKNDIEYIKAINMIKYYKNNYKWVAYQTKKYSRCTVDLAKAGQKTFNTFDECRAYIKSIPAK